MNFRPAHIGLRSAVPAALLALFAIGAWGQAVVKPADPRPAPVGAAGGDDKDLDDEESAQQLAVTRLSLANNCLICHGDELIRQQRLTAKQWAAEVEKMVGWGSPLPREEAPALVDYLARQYPTDAAPFDPARLAVQQALAPNGVSPQTPPSGDLARGKAAFATNCASCHGADAKGGDLGPNLVEIPVLLQPGDFEKVTRDGRHRMPGFRLLLDDRQSRDILAWLSRLD